MTKDGGLQNLYIQMREQKAVDQILTKANVEEIEMTPQQGEAAAAPRRRMRPAEGAAPQAWSNRVRDNAINEEGVELQTPLRSRMDVRQSRFSKMMRPCPRRGKAAQRCFDVAKTVVAAPPGFGDAIVE